MNFDKDDPRLFDYVLGELGEDEAAEVARALDRDPKLAAAVAELRATAEIATEALRDAGEEKLTDAQRARLLSEAKASAPSKRRRFRPLVWGGLALAASVLVVIGLVQINTSQRMQMASQIDSASERGGLDRQQTRPMGIDDIPITYQQTQEQQASPKPNVNLNGDGSGQPSAATPPPPPPPVRPEPPARHVPTELLPIPPPPPERLMASESPALSSGATDTTGATPSEPRRSGGLQHVVVGGELRMRGDWYAQEGQSSKQPPVPEREALQPLGYAGEVPDEGGVTVNVSGLGWREARSGNTEQYEPLQENAFLRPLEHPLSTFSVDVDTASYTNVRRFLDQGTWPPANAVRIEELINYFKYDYAPPSDGQAFAVHVEVAACPWAPTHQLARIGLKGREVPMKDRPAANLVFLLDTSGSMKDPDKLPLLQRAMTLLADQLTAKDTVTIVGYAGDANIVLEPTPGNELSTIKDRIAGLRASGSTNGAGGIEKAYTLASDHFIKDGVNRVLLATDGDFNVGVDTRDGLLKLIADKAKSGVFLTVLGFGEGNLKDGNLEGLADRGNGSYHYIDNFSEARRVLLDQVSGTLMTIAKDVKVQVEFNPARVGAYRLLGYENRVMAARDFNDDRKDAGEIGSGHTVTALYELVPAGEEGYAPGVGALKYQRPEPLPENVVQSQELMTVNLRYKDPGGDTSKLIEQPVAAAEESKEPSADFQFASAVAAFGMLLRSSDYRGNATFDEVLAWATAGKGTDPEGRRAEFINLVKTAQAIQPK